VTVMTSQRNADLLRRQPEVLHRWIRARGNHLVSLDRLRSLPDPVVVGSPDQALPNRGASIRIP
jgi:hypothetical protein